jgi:hypothetical protein
MTISADGAARADAAADANGHVSSETRALSKVFGVDEGMSGRFGVGVGLPTGRTTITTMTGAESLMATAFDDLAMTSLLARPSEATFTFDGTAATAFEDAQFGLPDGANDAISSYAEAEASSAETSAYTFNIVGASGGAVAAYYESRATGAPAASYEIELIDDTIQTPLGTFGAIGSTADGERAWTAASPGADTLIVSGESDVGASASASALGAGDGISMNWAADGLDASFRMSVTTAPDPRFREPSTWAMVLVGFAGLGCLVWRWPAAAAGRQPAPCHAVARRSDACGRR